ncbi:Long chain fatty acid elongase [Ceraceosorus bombacis]|uniref:Elongation of fatty acids protein n=1 Tax=Ceraceosorus bombacis TaxID=401625 RepID=A0A0P1BM40_9BASI|nr:Long chain fatty acid elongase [Ceraceosorus bombacis]
MTSHASLEYPFDAPGSTFQEQMRNLPYPAYPFEGHALLSRIFTPAFYSFSLSPIPVLLFSLAYYLTSHTANHLHSAPPTDWTKPNAAAKNGGGGGGGGGGHLRAKLLRWIILAHNALLAIYSAATFVLMAPPVLDLFFQGWRAAGSEGLTLALCSTPTNDPYLGRWAYIFYLSKYYEVIDSLILYLKGKQIGHLQSYHHAGALICMWIAVRYQSQPVWVFCVFNSFVHTFMYSYYFCSAMRWPFPRALKRNLTTMQILQIASGTLLTNVYLLVRVQPARVLTALTRSQVSTLLPASIFAARHPAPSQIFSGLVRSDPGSLSTSAEKAMLLGHYAAQRALTKSSESCLQSKGAEMALHVNTMYMTPLLMLFAHFFMRSYLKPKPRVNGIVSGKAVTRAGEAGQKAARQIERSDVPSK